MTGQRMEFVTVVPPGIDADAVRRAAAAGIVEEFGHNVAARIAAGKTEPTWPPPRAALVIHDHPPQTEPGHMYTVDVVVDDVAVARLVQVSGYTLARRLASDGKLGTLTLDIVGIDVEIDYVGHKPPRA